MSLEKKIQGKERRQVAIREILRHTVGSTQEEIRKSLKKAGIEASQATLSRDLREMGVVKVPENSGRAWYRLNGTVPGFKKEAAGYSIRYETVGNFLVIKTAPGGAPGFCAILDRKGWDEIVGTVAGDDTILVIGRTPEGIAAVAARLDMIL